VKLRNVVVVDVGHRNDVILSSKQSSSVKAPERRVRG
jgi:hypothetical protein